jgi:hypothetical protein
MVAQASGQFLKDNLFSKSGICAIALSADLIDAVGSAARMGGETASA